MTPLPRSLFGRLVLLIVAAVALAVMASVVLFRSERLALVNRQVSETRLVQLQALRAALTATDDPERSETLESLADAYGVEIYPETAQPPGDTLPAGLLMADLAARLHERLGPGAEVRFAPRLHLLFVRIEAADAGYWIGIPVPTGPPDAGATRALAWTLVVLALLLVAAYIFARYLARPLRDLTAAVARVGGGELPAPLPESGPSEIAAVNRGFNAMTANLRRVDEDRALLLAGVSHDLRTPLARLRLGIELSVPDEALREGMVSDIDEMDRIIGQFLDFARGEAATPLAQASLDDIVQAAVARYAAAGNDVRFVPGGIPPLPLKANALSRLVANLVDNALAYGAPPVEVATHLRGSEAWLEVIDHGPGIAPADVARLKQPFTRAATSRARADGAAGAGLGLAIVERIARLHGGSFEIDLAPGGGTIARVRLPLGDAR
ncbi:MAG: HAMP domain-containing protein [Burkholderiales bacterium]|nr:HAMP domain-containing protein [Burkholderiales bacterium]